MSDFDQNTVPNADSYALDVDSIQEAKFENLPAGWYNCICIEHEFALSQSSGSPMWSTKWEVEDGPSAGKKLYSHFSFAEKAAPYTKANIQKLAPDLLTNPAYRDGSNKLLIQKIGDEAALVSRRAQLKIGFQNYEGEKRNTVKDFRPMADSNQFLGA